MPFTFVTIVGATRRSIVTCGEYSVLLISEHSTDTKEKEYVKKRKRGCINHYLLLQQLDRFFISQATLMKY